MTRKCFLPLLFFCILFFFGCTTKPTPIVTPTSPVLNENYTPTPDLATPLPADLEAWLDDAIIPDEFREDDSIIIHFNQPMDRKSAPAPLVFVPRILGDFTWNEDATTLMFAPTSILNPLVTYEVALARQLTSASGDTFDFRQEWNFTRTVPPKVVSRQPSDPQLLISTKTITLVFSHEMNHASVESAFSIEPAIPFTFAWDKKVLKISLDTDFAPGQAFQFSLGEGIQTRSGESFQPLEWTYKTPALTVEFARVSGLSRLTPFNLVFNYPINPTTLDLSVEPALSYETQWDATKKTLTLIPTEPLVDQTLYTFTVQEATTAPAGSSDTVTLSEPQTWTYAAPALVASFDVEPTDDRRPPLVFISNVPLHPDSVATALQIEPAFEFTLVWNNAYTIFKITPNQPLPSLTKYTLRFVGEISDEDGFPVNGLGVHRFTTPSPITNEPEMGYGNGWDYNYYGPQPILPDEDFLVRFDRPMDPESTLAALAISPTVDGEIVWLSPEELQIVPSAGHLDALTKYALTLAPSALDADGNPILTEAYTWNVLTSDFPSQASFGEYGANVQVVDLDGRRAIQIAADGRVETVHLELYRLTIDQFIQLDANTFVVPWGNGRGKPLFDLSGATLAASWDSEVVYATGENYNNHPAEIYLPEDLDEGLYVINLHTDHLDDQMLLVASRGTISVQYNDATEGGSELSAWVSNINGFVMPGVDVRVYDQAGAQIASGVTDAIGVFKTTLPAGVSPYLVVARRDGGITVAGVGGVWGTRGYGGVRQGSADGYVAYLYTERPIYRPGQTVNYKGIVRLDNDVNFRLPAPDLAATLNVRDARGNVIASSPVTLNAFGTFNGSFDIASGAMLGDYELELVIDEEYHTQSFKVQDYKKPDIAVTVTTDRAEYVAGETITVTVDTRYLFGEPVANATLKVNTFELMPYYSYWWYELPTGGAGEYRWFSSGNEISMTANENGFATFTLPAKLGQHTQDYYYYGDQPVPLTRWGIEVTADDGSNQEISSFATVNVQTTATQAQIEMGGWLYAPTAPIPVTARLSSAFGDPLAARDLELVVEKRKEDYWDFMPYQTLDLTTDENGVARLDLTLENGSYRLTLSGQDSRGNRFQDTRHFYVFEPESTWLLDYTTELALTTEDRDYTAGDTAEVIVETTISGQGLLTIARGGILDQRIIQLEPPYTVLNIPIREEYAPNVFVVVQTWNPLVTDLQQYEYAYESIPDSILRWDAVQLNVPDTTHRLTVEITPDKTIYAPREEATFTVRVTDASGDPARAELSLALVDEAIFLLADDPAGDIHDAFYFPRYLSMFFSDSLAPWRYLWFEEGGRGGGGDDGMPGSPRSDFPDTALWLPTVETNGNGEATVTVTLPDTLTSWRLTAKAVTLDALIGESQTNFLTQQPIVVRPLPPRNLTAGDTFILSALVHNFSEVAQDLTVTATAEGIDLPDAANQHLLLNPGESQVVTWSGTAARAGEATFTITATAPSGVGDAVQMNLSIQPLMIPVVRHEAGQFTGTEQVSVLPEMGALPESGVHVQVDATVAGSLLSGVEYLTGYPYGCVEQTMSRALPNAVVARAFAELGLSERADLLGLESKLDASVQRLYAFQHDDGGWGWWFDDPSDGYQTAWVVFGLAVTAESGYLVDAEVLERGAEYLKDYLEEMNAPTRAFALYAMATAGYGDLDLTLDQTANLHELDLFSRASLALALHKLGESALANELLDEILAEMIIAPNGNVSAPGENHDGYYHQKFMSSNVRTTAMVLRAVMVLRPNSDLRPGMVQWLQARRSSHGWGTTNETAFSLLALTDHLLSQQREVEAAVVRVYLNDSLLVTGTLSAETLSVAVDIPVADLADGENVIRLETDAVAPLYYAVSSEMFVGHADIEADGLDLSREYLNPDTLRPVATVQEGDLVLVRLTVKLPDPAFYLMLTDHLPGGLEALNEGLNTTGHDTAVSERAYWDYEWDWFMYDDYGYNNKEIWPDRVLFFITEMGKGTRVFEYYARATVSGEFTALPAEIEAMYDESVWGRSSSQSFEVMPTILRQWVASGLEGVLVY